MSGGAGSLEFKAVRCLRREAFLCQVHCTCDAKTRAMKTDEHSLTVEDKTVVCKCVCVGGGGGGGED